MNEAPSADAAPTEGPITLRVGERSFFILPIKKSFSKVVDQTGEEMQFRVKKDTKMQKIFDSYAQRKGIPVQSIRFVVDENRINGDVTPKMLELEDGDQIDAV